MELFEAVKEAVPARTAAEFYGIDVKRNGMARCVFHEDRNPSMKLDKRYHCFACQADGDVINLVAQIFGIGNKEAAEKIAADFGLAYEERKKVTHRPGRGRKKKQVDQIEQVERQRMIRFEETQKRFYLILTDYFHLLREWKEKHVPASPEDEPDEYFIEALQNLDPVEHVLDCFLYGTLEERVDIINDYGRKVKEYERRIEQYRSEEAGKTGQVDGSLHAATGKT